MMNDKRKYIASRYLQHKPVNEKNKLFNGYHFQKGKRVARPFSSFYPEPKDIQKNSVDN
ncbi:MULTISPECIES: hypothetical protein [unclassified Oceanobacillus]|uniref:hypothetical protein n=1 Tax=unclassified Oceanobacillus TaxID=2630292 RepID=UPI00300DF025